MKNFPRILSRVYGEPWAIDLAGHKAIRDLLSAKLSGEIVPAAVVERSDVAAATGGATQPAGDPYEGLLLLTPQIALIPVEGIIGKRLDWIESYCGGCDLDDISLRLSQAEGHPTVRRVILWFNTPGGSVTGLHEVAKQIRDLDAVKPVDAWCETKCFSAGYYLASQARRVSGTPSSMFGSIGTILAWVDQTERMKKEGDAAMIFQGGSLKSAGYDGKEMSPEERALFQGIVDHAYQDFKATVTSTRPQIQDASMQGQPFYAEDAQAAGLVDELAWGLGDLVAQIELELSQP